MSRQAEWLIVVFGILFPGIRGGQAVFKKPEIHSLHIYSDIKYRFATTTVTSRIKNVDTKSREAVFDVTLPNEAFITNLTLEIDGKIVLGEIKEKEVARKQYEAAQQRGESAGYIGTRQRETNRFNLAVTVAPQDKVSFNLTYQELLKRTHGHYEQVIYIDPGQPVPNMAITVSILESREITDLRVPPLRNDVMADIEDLSSVTVINTPTPKTAHVKFIPSIEFQTAQTVGGMAGQFVVQYDVEREMDIGDVLVVNGYFVHFFAPEGFKPIPNDILFILVTSGSMTGKKLNQLKEAMHSILTQMNEGDRMNIMTFSGSTSFWKTEMVDIMDEDTMEEAKSHISFLKAGGWTNIDLALTTGITFLRDRDHIDGAVRSPVVVFLTDGEPTRGETNSEHILKNIRSVNEVDIPVFSLAFGEYADYDLVKKISIQNNGLGRKIYEASDAALQIAGFYNEVSVTLLNNITFQYLDAPVANVTQHEYTNYFNGSEVVISGRLETLDALTLDKILTMRIIGNSVDGPELVLTGEMSDNLVDLSLTDNETITGDFEKITEKVWAYLTIKQLLDKEVGTSNKEEKKAYNRQILDLSLKYDFVTPLTSMVVTLPNEENVQEAIPVRDGETPRLRQQKQAANYPRQKYGSSRKNFLPPTLLNSPSGAASNLGRPLYARYDDADSDVMQSFPMSGVSKFGPDMMTKKRRKNQAKKMKRKWRRKNRKNNKRKNKRKNKRSGFQYPLRVMFPNLTDPMCFSMYDDTLEDTPRTYLIYADTDADLKVKVKLEKTLDGSWTKQGSIKEIDLISGDHHTIITNETFQSRDISAEDNVPWEVTYSPTDTAVPLTGIMVKFNAFDITIKANDAGYLTVVADRSTQHGSLAGDGIIGQIMTKKVQVEKIQRSKKNRKRKSNIAMLKVDGTRLFAISRELGPPGQGTEKCWALLKKEQQMLDMTLTRVI